MFAQVQPIGPSTCHIHCFSQWGAVQCHGASSKCPPLQQQLLSWCTASSQARQAWPLHLQQRNRPKSSCKRSISRSCWQQHLHHPNNVHRARCGWGLQWEQCISNNAMATQQLLALSQIPLCAESCTHGMLNNQIHHLAFHLCVLGSR